MESTATIEEVSGKSFDFIIIGGGTSGLCIAARLTEDALISVLVLEAGEANLKDPEILLPKIGNTVGNPKYDWRYNTVKQKHCSDRELYWARGKGLGGCSAINFLCWGNPSKKDLDAFEALGNPGWNWQNYTKYAKKAEGFVEPLKPSDAIIYDAQYHGVDGPIRTCFSGIVSGVEKPAKEAMHKLGVKNVKDSAEGFVSGPGTFSIPNSIDPVTYTRSYSANAYYEPNASRKNLTVLVSAHVAQITTVSNVAGTLTATGVEFLYDGKTHEVKANKEVILSAGAINTPQVLELSGIGSPDVLHKAGVEFKLNLPGVGNNVQDHYNCGLTYELTEEAAEAYSTFDSLSDPEVAVRELALHAEQKGLFTLSIIMQTFLPLSAVSPSASALQKTLKETIEANIKKGLYSQGLKKQYELQLDHIKGQWPSLEIITFPGYAPGSRPPEPKKKYLSLRAFTNHPFSRGSIHIISNDPLAPPAIDPAVFAEPYDLANMVELVKFIRKLIEEEPLKNVLTGFEVNPGADIRTEEQLAEFVKSTVGTTFHTIGSASMLPLEDGGVVGADLKVHNTTNIRVADTSIVPLHVGAHTQALAYSIGEKAADIIKGIA